MSAKDNGQRTPRKVAARARYRRENRRERNKARNLVRHLKRQPQDAGARGALTALYDANPIALREHRIFVLSLAS